MVRRAGLAVATATLAISGGLVPAAAAAPGPQGFAGGAPSLVITSLPRTLDVDGVTLGITGDGARALVGTSSTPPTATAANASTWWFLDLQTGAYAPVFPRAKFPAASYPDPSAFGQAAMSADGNRVVFDSNTKLLPTDTDLAWDVYSLNVTTGALSLVTTGTLTGRYPVVSADGKVVVYTTLPFSDLAVVHRNDAGVDSVVTPTPLPAGYAPSQAAIVAGDRVSVESKGRTYVVAKGGATVIPDLTGDPAADASFSVSPPRTTVAAAAPLAIVNRSYGAYVPVPGVSRSAHLMAVSFAAPSSRVVTAVPTAPDGTSHTDARQLFVSPSGRYVVSGDIVTDRTTGRTATLRMSGSPYFSSDEQTLVVGLVLAHKTDVYDVTDLTWSQPSAARPVAPPEITVAGTTYSASPGVNEADHVRTAWVLCTDQIFGELNLSFFTYSADGRITSPWCTEVLGTSTNGPAPAPLVDPQLKGTLAVRTELSSDAEPSVVSVSYSARVRVSSVPYPPTGFSLTQPYAVPSPGDVLTVPSPPGWTPVDADVYRCDGLGTRCALDRSVPGTAVPVVPGDIGSRLRVRARFGDAPPYQAFDSAPTTLIAATFLHQPDPVRTPAPNPANLSLIFPGGSYLQPLQVKVGEHVEASSTGSWSGDPADSTVVEWLDCGWDGCITLATGTSWTIRPIALPHTLVLRETRTNAAGSGVLTSQEYFVYGSGLPAPAAPTVVPAMKGLRFTFPAMPPGGTGWSLSLDGQERTWSAPLPTTYTWTGLAPGTTHRWSLHATMPGVTATLDGGAVTGSSVAGFLAPARPTALKATWKRTPAGTVVLTWKQTRTALAPVSTWQARVGAGKWRTVRTPVLALARITSRKPFTVSVRAVGSGGVSAGASIVTKRR